MVGLEKSSMMRSAPRLMQVNRHKFLGALRGKNHWPSPKEVRETFEELALPF
jgi:ubiquinone biosynthesis protein